ncbi:CoxG family protein [Novosphingobium sp. Chol11]|uniref:CoxG family protein n=1 Tax=Novosphingobium sp. Chol11 TaxID=1385763 RepID=UPI0025CCBB67|nr:carbon monoxide dehydrogenase subunit G [Novosphingobium sp. Chol11]
MEITGRYDLPCSPEAAWAAINDTAVLKACLKGCEALERTSETEFSGRVAAKIGPVSARFAGTMRQTEIDEPRSCKMEFEGQGGVAGFAKGSAFVTLEPREGGGTALSYVAQTQIGGKLAQMGARLIEGTAKAMADDFFGKFAAVLADVEESATPNAAAPEAGAIAEAIVRSGARQWLILAGLGLAAVAGAVFILR